MLWVTPLKIVLTGGQVHNLAGADALLLPGLAAKALLADTISAQAAECDWHRDPQVSIFYTQQAVVPVSPSKS